MKKILPALAIVTALVVICSPFAGARGPGDGDKRDKEQRSFNPPQGGGLPKFSPPAASPPVNRSGPSINFSRPPSVESARPRSNPNIQQPTLRRQNIEPQPNITPRASQPQRPTNVERSGPEKYSKPSLSIPSPSIRQELSPTRNGGIQRFSAPPPQGLAPQMRQSTGRRPTQNELRQFLNIPQGQAPSQRQPGMGKIGAAALGGAVGVVALDQMLNRGKPGLQTTGAAYMPDRGYWLNETMTPGSAQAIRDSFPHRFPGTFSTNWRSQHPNLAGYYWHNHVWPYRPWNYWWRPATWVALSSWIAWNWGPPLIYNYGSNFYYDNSYVFLNGQRLCSAVDYYDQASSALSGIPDVAGDVEQWMPLGVFALTRDPKQESTMVLQLALNKDGIIQGTYYNADTGVTKPIKGIVEKENQRAIWTFADESGATLIMETGLYNFTQDQTGVLVHLGKTQTEQWFLVRLSEPAAQEETVK